MTEVQDGFQSLSLSCLGWPFLTDVSDTREVGLGVRKLMNLVWDTEFEVPVGCPSGDTQPAVGLVA